MGALEKGSAAPGRQPILLVNGVYKPTYNLGGTILELLLLVHWYIMLILTRIHTIFLAISISPIFSA